MYKLIATGRLGADAKIFETNGRKAITFSMAHNEKYKDKDGNEVEKTTWIRCSQWHDGQKSLNVMKVLKKGAVVLIEGEPKPSIYTNSEGKTEVSNNVQISPFDRIEVLCYANDGTEAKTPANNAQNTQPPENHPSDDLPY